MIETEKVEAWGRLLRISRALTSAVEADLKAAGLPPSGWYDALLELVRAGPQGLRQFEMRDRMLMEQYNLSRLIDRMEAAGLVTRHPCPEDGRGQIVRITDPGLELLDTMWPVYRDAIGERFARHLTMAEADRLNALFRRLRPTDPVGLRPET